MLLAKFELERRDCYTSYNKQVNFKRKKPNNSVISINVNVNSSPKSFRF